LSKVKKIKRLCGDVAGYVAQTNASIDAEIGQKDHLWMETNWLGVNKHPGIRQVKKSAADGVSCG